MTATIEEIDLSWVTFSDQEPDQACERPEGCDRVAVYRVKWGPDPRAGMDMADRCHNITLMCLPCFEEFSKPGLTLCHRCSETGVARLKRMVFSEFIR